jgi:hypothetical protein
MMDNKDKNTFTEEDRKRIIETSFIVHEVIKENAGDKTRKKWWLELLKHPLLLLILGSLASGVIVFEYQKRYAKSEELRNAKNELIKEISSLTGKLLTMSENVIYLHQEPIENREQIINTNRNYNNACEEFNSNISRIANSLNIIFEDKDITQSWQNLQNETKNLNEVLARLHDFQTTVISEEHSRRIKQSVDEIEEIKGKLNDLTSHMIQKFARR